MEYGRKGNGDKGTNLCVISEDTLRSIFNGRPIDKCVRCVRKHV
jgi:hypothetical protein